MLCRNGRRTLKTLGLRVGLFVLAAQTAVVAKAQSTSTGADPGLTTSSSVHNDTSPPLREIPSILRAVHEGVGRERRSIKNPPLPKGLGGFAEFASEPMDPVLQDSVSEASAPEPIQNFEGVGNLNGVLPPDTTGDVGPNHYIQMVNLSFQIFDKTGASLYGPVDSRTLWQGFGGICETNNDGDGIVLYDHLANRWFISQFALKFTAPFDFHQCIAVSKTPDPLGEWYRYDFPYSTTKLNDYPKFGLWPDAYYMSVNQFLAPNFSWAGAGVVAYEREKMLQGLPARQVKLDLQPIDANFGGMLPSDLDGPAPPQGAPNYFAEVDDETWIPGSPVDAMRLWKFHVDWADTTQSTFGLAGQPNFILPTANFNPLCMGTRDCIPQPGTAEKLDAIADRLMFRLQYRNFGDHESLVVNHTVNAGTTGSPRAGIRWYEVRGLSGTPTIDDRQGTYAPADSDHRWMGSAALDVNGNMAVGYSVSSSATFPSVRYAGRLAGDPAGELSQGEGAIIAGSGSQTHTASRWGDYSMMSVDPDGCTFWFTSEYLQATGSAPWKTRIGSFRFASCAVGDTGSLEGTVTDTAGHSLAGATVAAGLFSTVTDAAGVYRILGLPVGTHEVTASLFGYEPSTATVVINNGAATVQDFTLSAAGPASLDGYVLDGSGANWPLYAKVSVSASGFPGVTVFTDPMTGYFSMDLVVGTTYTLTADAVYPGYASHTRTVTLSPTGATEGIELTVNAACNAPGYGIGGPVALSESFEGGSVPSGWSVIDNAGTGVGWTFNNPGGRANLTGGSGSFAIADSDKAGVVNMDSTLVTPTQDLSSVPRVMLEFDTDFRYFSAGPPEVADVDVSNDGGTTWTNVWKKTGVQYRGPKHETVDISALAARQANVQLRFHYYSASNDWWWQIDNVKLGNPQCLAKPGGLVVGNVYDANTGSGLDGATVQHDLGGSTLTRPTPDDPNLDEGFYWLFTPLPGSPFGPESLAPAVRRFAASKPRYGEDTETAVVIPRGLLELNFQLAAGSLVATPPSLEMSLRAGLTGQATLTFNNDGGKPASFVLKELNRAPAPALSQPGTFAEPNLLVDEKHEDDRDARAVASRASFVPAPASSDAAGNVISTFNTGLALPWGIGFDFDAGDMWIGNITAGSPLADDKNHRFLRDGTPTEDAIDTRAFRATWAADMTYDPYTGKLWQVNVGGDNCVYELDPVAKAATGNKICPAFGTSERGLAYDPTTDTFYAGSWNDQIIKHFDRSGQILDSRNVGLNISGLAFNSETGHLFVLTNGAAGFDVYVLDVRRGYQFTGSFDIEGLGNGQQAGLEMDCNGHLWAVNQATKHVIEVDSGETGTCSFLDIPWVSLEPRSGAVPASGSQQISVTFNSAGLAAGVYRGQLIVGHDTPYGIPRIPITLTVLNGPPAENVVWTHAVGVAVAGNSLRKTAPTVWGNAGACSTKAIVSGDGYVEFTASETNSYRMLGLGNGDVGQHFSEIDFALHANASGQLAVFENGASRGLVGVYTSGDRLRVGVESGVVKYYRNGSLIYTSRMAPVYPLLVDTALYSVGSTLNAVVLSGTLTQRSPTPGSAEDGSRRRRTERLWRKASSREAARRVR